jgi:Leucine-rich repeat (LRR) protein
MAPVCDTCSSDRRFCGAEINSDLPKATLGDPEFLTKAANVTHLSLARRRIVTTTTGYSASFSVMHSLTCLSLDSWWILKQRTSVSKNESISDAKTGLVRFLLSIPTLRQVSAENCQLTGEQVMTILSDNNNTAIEKLSLSRNALGPSFNLSDLCRYSNLTELYVAKAGLEEVNLKCTLERLERLDLSNNKISSNFVQCRSGKALLPALHWLNVSGNGMRLEEHLPDCFPHLSVLDISGNEIQYSFKEITPLVSVLLYFG